MKNVLCFQFNKEINEGFETGTHSLYFKGNQKGNKDHEILKSHNGFSKLVTSKKVICDLTQFLTPRIVICFDKNKREKIIAIFEQCSLSSIVLLYYPNYNVYGVVKLGKKKE